jgi:hypothetical protein
VVALRKVLYDRIVVACGSKVVQLILCCLRKARDTVGADYAGTNERRGVWQGRHSRIQLPQLMVADVLAPAEPSLTLALAM